MSQIHDEAVVLDAIRNGYHDATITALDVKVARGILAALSAAGWATPEEVRTIVAAAGGRVSVPMDIAVDPPDVLYRERDFRNDAMVLTTRRSAEVSS